MPKQLTLREIWGSHGGPVVRTWPFQCGSLGSIPGGGILKYQKLCGTAKKKKTQREISFQNLDESFFFFFLSSLRVFIHIIFTFNFFFKIFILFILGCVGSLLQHAALLHVSAAIVAVSGGYSKCGPRASHCRGPSRCGAGLQGARASVVAAHGL